ncbi:MAG: class I SAM-dependent methyltransferase [Bacteroidetes bacterium]|nr:class I SAM-dependent methyltransferase [Bacteroidota bacterium]
MDENYLRELRKYELEKVMELLYPLKITNILDIGAGAGWQAKMFSEKGYLVTAIDVKESIYSNSRVFNVELYDGEHFPFNREMFDLIFSSHSLMYVKEQISFQEEIMRVLRPGGYAVHIIPSVGYALWNLIYHYVFLIKMIIAVISKSSLLFGHEQSIIQRTKKFTLKEKIIKALIPHALSKQDNCFTQIFYFSRYYWKNLFNRKGWVIKEIKSSAIYCSGYGFFGKRLSNNQRHILSYLFGSSSNIYLLKKPQ